LLAPAVFFAFFGILSPLRCPDGTYLRLRWFQRVSSDGACVGASR
jgi:hypothetical protein